MKFVLRKQGLIGDPNVLVDLLEDREDVKSEGLCPLQIAKYLHFAL
jgi:hypothetical protein